MLLSLSILYFIFPSKISAITYEETNQSVFQYNINNFKLEDDYIIINGWGTKVNDQLSTDGFSIFTLDDGNKAIKIAMNSSNTTSLEKVLNINGHANDRYTLSFWYKNEGLRNYNNQNFNNVLVNFNYNEPEIDEEPEELNPNENSWQYFTKTYDAKADYSGINVRFFEQMQSNNLYITNVSLYKSIPSKKYKYDVDSNLTSMSDYNEADTLLDYDSNNQLVQITNPRDKNLTFEYSNEIKSRIIKGVSKTGISNEIGYDENGNPNVVTITNKGINLNIEQGLYGIRSKGTDEYLRVTAGTIKVKKQKHLHDVWLLEMVTLDNNNYYKIKHSIVKKYLSERYSAIILDNAASLFEFIRNKNGSYLIKLKDSNKYLKNLNNLIAYELEENNSSYEFYLERIDYNYFIQTEATYAPNDKYVMNTIDSLLHKTYYDVNEETGATESITNANNQVTTHYYDSDDKLLRVSKNGRVVDYDYDFRNMLSKISDGSREYNFTYDNFLKVRSILVNNINLITNNYENNDGNLIGIVYGNNQSISFDYNELNMIKTIIKLNDTYNLFYTSNGDIAKIISSEGIIKYKYDLSKRLEYYRNCDFEIKYIYDSESNIINKKYIYNAIENVVDSTLNDESEIATSEFNNDFHYNTNYDKLGRITNRNINNNYDVNYTYVTNGKRTSLILESIENNGDKYYYEYDKLNNITHIYQNGELINHYYYDNDNQLIEEENYIERNRIKYRYNDAGNILNKKIFDIETNVIISEDMYEYNDSNWCDKLTKFNNEFITYDNIGNPITIGNKVLTYTNGRELNYYSDSTYNVNYKYNLNGIRTSKIVNNVETKYYLEGTNIIYEKRGNKVIYYLRENNDNLVGFNYENHNYYYLKNGKEDIIGILDENLIKIVSYRYDSWGNIIELVDVSNNNIGEINPFRYRGYYYDSETGLYYLNSRYYNPSWGRFINTDSYITTGNGINDFNMFTYCRNNPINYSDYNGHFFDKVFKFFNNIFDKVVSFVSDIVSVRNSVSFADSDPDVSKFLIFNLEKGSKTKLIVSGQAKQKTPLQIEYNQEVFRNPQASATLTLGNASIGASYGPDILESSISYEVKKNTTWTATLRGDLQKLNLGIEFSTSYQEGSGIHTDYRYYSVDGLTVVVAAVFVASYGTVEVPLPVIPCYP